MCVLSFASLREGGGPLAVEGVRVTRDVAFLSVADAAGASPPPYGIAIILKLVRHALVGEGFPLPLVCHGLQLPSPCGERVKFAA